MGINREIPCHPPHHNIGQHCTRGPTHWVQGWGVKKTPFNLSFGQPFFGLQRARRISMLRPTRQNGWTTLGKMEQAFWGREGGGVLEQDWIEPDTAKERGMAYFRILIETRVFMAQKLAGPQIRLRSNKIVPKSFLKHHPNHLLQRFSMSFSHLKKIAMLLSLC